MTTPWMPKTASHGGPGHVHLQRPKTLHVIISYTEIEVHVLRRLHLARVIPDCVPGITLCRMARAENSVNMLTDFDEASLTYPGYA